MNKTEEDLIIWVDNCLKEHNYDEIYRFFQEKSDRTWAEYNSMAYVYIAFFIDSEEQKNGVENHIFSKVRNCAQIINDFRMIRFLTIRAECAGEKAYKQMVELILDRGYSLTVLLENIRYTAESPELIIEEIKKYLAGEI